MPVHVIQDAPPGQKRCSGCAEAKLFSEFHRKTGKPFGLSSRCKKCLRTGVEGNREKIAIQQRAYKERMRERIKAYDSLRHRRRREEFWAAAGASPKAFACEVCGKKGKTVFDHDHVTGKFRGWLCNHCNVVLGHVGDDPALLEQLKHYLETHYALHPKAS